MVHHDLVENALLHHLPQGLRGSSWSHCQGQGDGARHICIQSVVALATGSVKVMDVASEAKPPDQRRLVRANRLLHFLVRGGTVRAGEVDIHLECPPKLSQIWKVGGGAYGRPEIEGCAVVEVLE